MYIVSKNKVIFKIYSYRDGTQLLAALWWRKRVLNFPAILNIILPKKIYKRKQNRLIWTPITKSFSIKSPDIEELIETGCLFETENEEDLFLFVCEQDYPKEFIDFFLKRV